jgi:hypothetical protein
VATFLTWLGLALTLLGLLVAGAAFVLQYRATAGGRSPWAWVRDLWGALLRVARRPKGETLDVLIADDVGIIDPTESSNLVKRLRADAPVEEHIEALYVGIAELHERITAETTGLRAEFAKADSALGDDQRATRAVVDRLDADAVDVTVRTVPLQVLALVLLALGSLFASIPVLYDLT